MGKKTVSKSSVSKTGRGKSTRDTRMSAPTPSRNGNRYGCGGKVKK